MTSKSINLAKETREIGIKTSAYNINVYTANIECPMVIVNGDAVIQNDWCFGHENKYAIIEEKNKTEKIFKKGFFEKIFSVRKIVAVSSDGKVTINGCTVSDEKTTGEGEVGSIDLVIPSGKNMVKRIEIENMSGSIKAIDLNIGKNTSPSSFVVKTVFGDITLERFQAMHTDLKTVEGNINAEIYESFENYEMDLKSLTGKVDKLIKETRAPQRVFDDRYSLEAETITGDIKVLFKGKN